MHKYIVTYRTLALMNHEIEVSEPDADKVRQQLFETEAKRQPAVFGRDWGWTDCVKTVVIEADNYSVAANGSAHFYRTKRTGDTLTYSAKNGELVYSVATPVTIGIEGDEGVTEPWSHWGRKVEEAGVTVPKTDVSLTYDQIVTLRNGLKELDPGKQFATDSQLDALLSKHQISLWWRTSPCTRREDPNA